MPALPQIGPLGIALEQRKDLLRVRDGLPPQDAAADLVDLALGIAQVAVDLLQEDRRDVADDQVHAGLAHPHEQRLSLLQVGAMGLANVLLLGCPLVRILGGGVLESLHLPVALRELAQLVGTLAPPAATPRSSHNPATISMSLRSASHNRLMSVG